MLRRFAFTFALGVVAVAPAVQNTNSGTVARPAATTPADTLVQYGAQRTGYIIASS